jgi:hypothetical protein
MAKQGVVVFEDGTHVRCIIHDMLAINGENRFGMRVELFNVPSGKVSDTFVGHMRSGRVTQYTPGWKYRL